MVGSRSLDRFYKYLDWIFPIYFVVYFIEFYFGLWGISVGVKFLCILLSFVYASVIIKKASQNSGGFRQLFTLLYVYIILSFLMYIFNGVSIRCYLNELFNLIPAMFFVYVGLAEPQRNNSFFRKFLIACSICMGIGLVFYVTAPGWFVNRRIEILASASYNDTNYTDDTLLQNLRFSSYLLDTYETDMFAIIALSFAFFSYYLKNNTNYKYEVLFIFINLIAAILTQQRVAMAAAGGIAIFYVFYGILKRGGKQTSKILFWMLLSFLLIGTVVILKFGDRVEQLQELLGGRMDNMSMSKALSERDYQLELITKHWTMPLFGHGAGSGGAFAGSLRYPHVSDAAYLEFLYEYGVVGSLFFILIIVNTLKRGIKHLRYYTTELMIITFVLAAMLGSNTLTMGYMTIFPFWYSIGRIWNKEHYQYIVANRIRI